jgi:hypothetical protein
MSFFGGSKKVYVSSVIYPIGNELDKIPDIVKASVIGSGMKGTSRSYGIKKAIIDGLGVKFHQAFAYAKKSYWAGLPLGLWYGTGEAAATTLTMLVTEWLTPLYAPTPIEVKSAILMTDTNYQTIIHQQIESKYNYDFFDERVYTTIFDIPVESTLELLALPPDDILHPDQFGWRLTFTKPDASTVFFDEWYDFSLFTNLESIENRVFIEFSIAGAPAVTTSYSYGDGNASLNLFLQQAVTKHSTTFPAIPIKRNGVYLDTNKFYDNLSHPVDWWKTQPAYSTSKIYGRRLGFKVDDLIDLVRNNAKQKDIDYAFVQPGTMISSPNACAAEYHYNYFNRVRLVFPDGKPAFDAWNAKTGSSMNKSEAYSCPAQVLHIRDPDDRITKGITDTVNMAIVWRYITYEEKTGTLAAPYVVECGAQEKRVISHHWKGASKDVRYDFTPLYLRKRLTDTTYAEIMVYGLWHENYVYKDKSVKSGVWDAFNDPDGNYGSGFLIPLDFDIFSSLSAREQLQLAQEGIHIIFNCYQVVKEKWYQTGIFKIVLFIVAIVVIVLSWGTLSPYVAGLYGAVYGAVAAVVVSATLAMAIASVLTALIIATILVSVQLLAKEAGDWAAEHWGPVWGAVVSVAVTIALTWGITSFANTAFNIAVTPMTLTQQVVMGASYLFSALSTYTQYDMEQLAKQQEEFQAYVDDSNNPMKQLEKLWDENFPDMKLPAQMWFAPMEKMDDWLMRTLASGDTLVQRLTAPIEYLSEITLTPTLQ